MSSAQDLPPSGIPIFTTLAAYREWRHRAFREGKSVGFVATMGALHEGHLSLVKRSLQSNDLTVLSIFVNPAQFAPHEDLATYPRTLPHDLELLNALSLPHPTTEDPARVRKPSAVFAPTVLEMYPSGITQDVAEQKGTFVEVKGYGHQMEGRSRPTFFRGVATVVTKLFNAIQPDHTYFGQKDIQQALLLKRMVKDLLMAYPSPDRLHIVPTMRDPTDGLALSSRNAYLSPSDRRVAPTLYAALNAAKSAWESGASKDESIRTAVDVVEKARQEAKSGYGEVDVQLDYVEMNDSDTFEVLEGGLKSTDVNPAHPVILSGAMWVGRTRLIDNVLLGDVGKVIEL
ncbi:Pantoate-beta-alanine ligase [Punctularia strigosozonata HHB-11173 SS5]|uniref:Pantoate--beta-alanine ligase n=1 Tax=Punctularia strigosozonata (strain HHB-11173) TaxID=741275 RepID=R7S3M2_PUNST|nr:Pantoate-beta-alanine ligase [Punctularia strigosozonata HHB-11173 SS5]EIN03821.1 Pantoate-beta-alanine ligase [Punctularia strigosozonata HHB-11173 SS5]